MALMFFITAAVNKTYPAPPNNSTVPPSGIATVALIYLFVIAYNMSWGALPWPYVSEIFPTRIREPGIGVGVASQWLWAFVFTLATPYMVNDIAWGTFLVWGCFNVIIAVGTWGFLKETKGKSLEEINAELKGREGVFDRRTKAAAGEMPPVEAVGSGSGSWEEESIKGTGKRKATRVDEVC